MNNQALHNAIQEGNLTKVEEQLRNGVSINHLFGMKGTPLCAAVAANKEKVVDFLIHSGCDVNAKDYDGEPPLCMAIRKGFPSLARTLIKHNDTDLNKVDPITGDHPLVIAILKNDLGTVRLLVEYGCDINKRKGKENKTALHVAVATDDLEVVKILLKHGASMTFVSASGMNPFLSATHLNYTDIVQYMLENANKNTEDLLKLGGLYDTMKEYLLNHTSQILKDSALHIAARNGNAKLAELFLMEGALVNGRNTFGHTPLFLACSEVDLGYMSVVKTLLSDKSINTEITCYNKDGSAPVRQRNCTALQVAISRGNFNIAKTLLENGASINQPDSMGVTPLAYALLCDKLEIAQYILDNCSGLDVHLTTGTGENLLWPAVTSKDPKTLVRSLLNLGCQVNHANDSGETPLHAALDASLAAVEVLASNGANLNVCYDDMSPLHICAADHLLDESKVLIYYGADMNVRNTVGLSVLEIALDEANYNFEFISLLLNCGCDLREETGLRDIIAQLSDDDDELSEEENADVLARLMHSLETPLSLKVMVRNTIRHHLLSCNVSIDCIQNLPLPKSLIMFLQLLDSNTSITLPLF